MVFINQEARPYVLEANGTLDLAALQLQPSSIVINRSVTLSTIWSFTLSKLQIYIGQLRLTCGMVVHAA